MNNILERRFTFIEVLPHTTLLAVVEWKTGFVPPSIEALVRTKTIVGITNKVDIMGTIGQLMPMWHVSPHS
jgi:hypothetical protein